VIGQELQNPTMVVPVGENVHIVLRSSDVIHGFYVPEFNSAATPAGRDEPVSST